MEFVKQLKQASASQGNSAYTAKYFSDITKTFSSWSLEVQ